MAFQISTSQYATVRFERLRGENGAGYFRLIFRFQFLHHGRGKENVRTVGPFECDVHLVPDGEQPVRLGRAYQVNQQDLVFLTQSSDSLSIDLGLELDRHRLAFVERIRDGGPLAWHLTVSALASGPEGAWRPLDSMRAESSQSEWVAALSQMGYAEFDLLEIPSHGGEAHPAFTRAFDYLAETHVHMRRGEYRDAVGKCREVMEAIASALGEDGTWLADSHKLLDDVRGSSKAARIQLLRRATWLLAAPARHGDQKSSEIDWTRTDAVMAVHIATAILGRVSRGYVDDADSSVKSSVPVVTM